MTLEQGGQSAELTPCTTPNARDRIAVLVPGLPVEHAGLGRRVGVRQVTAHAEGASA